MVNFEKQLFESVQIHASDVVPPSAPANPAIIHTIAATGASPFTDLYLFPAGSSKSLPEYQEDKPPYKADEPPYSLEGFTLASDGAPLGAGATQLWALANANGSLGLGSLTVLHCVTTTCASGEWSQLLPKGNTRLEGVAVQSAPAPEPGSESAWLSRGSERDARVAHLNASGALEEQTLPGSQEPELGNLGGAGAITCPAEHDCWMATGAGWLFHLTDGTEYPQDTDPNFAGVISYRPLDEGELDIYPIGQPLDDSLANQVAPTPPSTQPASAEAPSPKHVHAKPLVTHVKSRLLHHRVLVISFVLTARAHVQLIGRRNKLVVAKTRAESLRAGAHHLSLELNPARWPTKLKFEARPIEASSPSGGGSSGGGSDTIGT
jgi:hypothetical protein